MDGLPFIFGSVFMGDSGSETCLKTKVKHSVLISSFIEQLNWVDKREAMKFISIAYDTKHK
jgi:hypothetical protein